VEGRESSNRQVIELAKCGDMNADAMQPHQILRPGAKKFREPQSPSPPKTTSKYHQAGIFSAPREPTRARTRGESREHRNSRERNKQGGGWGLPGPCRRRRCARRRWTRRSRRSPPSLAPPPLDAAGERDWLAGATQGGPAPPLSPPYKSPRASFLSLPRLPHLPRRRL